MTSFTHNRGTNPVTIIRIISGTLRGGGGFSAPPPPHIFKFEGLLRKYVLSPITLRLYLDSPRPRRNIFLESVHSSPCFEKLSSYDICLFGFSASNRTIIPKICCCNIFWCRDQCVLCFVLVIVQIIVFGGWNCRPAVLSACICLCVCVGGGGVYKTKCGYVYMCV